MYLSVALAVCGAVVLMAGCALALAGEARRLESAGGSQSLISLGLVLIVGGFALGVAFAVVTAAGLRDGGETWDWPGSGVAGAGSRAAEAGSRAAWAGGPAGPQPDGGVSGGVPFAVADGLAGPEGVARPDGFAWADESALAAERARRGAAVDDRGGAGDWGQRDALAGRDASAGGADWDGRGDAGARGDEGESGDGPRVAGRDRTRAEDWLSHLRGSGLGSVSQPGRAAPAHWPASAGPGSDLDPGPGPGPGPGAGGFGPADYADEGWQLDGADWAESRGQHAAQPPAPEIHHPAAGRRHDTGQQAAYDTGQWRTFELDQPPPPG